MERKSKIKYIEEQFNIIGANFTTCIAHLASSAIVVDEGCRFQLESGRLCKTSRIRYQRIVAFDNLGHDELIGAEGVGRGGWMNVVARSTDDAIVFRGGK